MLIGIVTVVGDDRLVESKVDGSVARNQLLSPRKSSGARSHFVMAKVGETVKVRPCSVTLAFTCS